MINAVKYYTEQCMRLGYRLKIVRIYDEWGWLMTYIRTYPHKEYASIDTHSTEEEAAHDAYDSIEHITLDASRIRRR